MCCAFYLLCNQAQLLLNRSPCFGEQQLETAGAVIDGTQRLAQIVHQIRKHLFRLGQNQLAHGGARGDHQYSATQGARQDFLPTICGNAKPAVRNASVTLIRDPVAAARRIFAEEKIGISYNASGSPGTVAERQCPE
jgi:hypothetical protein